MGSGNSRMGPRPANPRPESRPRHGFSNLLCGGAAAASSSASASTQMQDMPSEKSVIPAMLHDSMLTESVQTAVNETHLTSSAESSLGSTNECMGSSQSSNDAHERLTGLRNAESSDSRKCLSACKEVVPSMPNTYCDLDMTPESTWDVARTSTKPELLEPLLRNDTALVPVTEVNNSTNSYGSHTSPRRFPSSMPQVEPRDSLENGTLSSENPSNETLGIQSSDSNSVSAVSSSSSTWHLLGEEPHLDTTSSGADILVSRGSQRNGTVIHVDVVTISSNVSPSGTGEMSDSQARRNSRRLFWDAFSRHSSRRNTDSPSIFSSIEDMDDMESHDRWLLDIGDDLFGNGVEDDTVLLRRRRHGSSGLSWHSRSEIRERLRAGFNDNNGQSTFCPSGLHPDGTCSCDTLLLAEESSARASISRIVMLAEALFEVLDEIHRQPASLSLSMVSLPAPESVVNSLPFKSYIKNDKVGTEEDAERCYICLADYEDGDQIRVLPCCHEYHMPCVDKWLKEIHGVCPLCRGDVCEATA